MSKQAEFISKHKQEVIEATHGTGLFPSVKMAQMIIESGWGNDYLPRVANNYFGIKKGTGWNGETIEVGTPKDAKKRSVFRKYNTPLDSIKDHSSFLIKNKRYENAGVFKAKTPEEQIDAIAKAGYAEAKDYAQKVKSVINSNNLKKLDEEAKQYKPKTKKPLDFRVTLLVGLGLVASYVLYEKLIKR